MTDKNILLSWKQWD